jgi:class 3 adenylate cyclase
MENPSSNSNHGIKSFIGLFSPDSNTRTPNSSLISNPRVGRTRNDQQRQQIADLYPFCTVLFSDISGFTAWSSSRDPEQVFVLLQSVYHAFDCIARRKNVYKVETVGDSYVAATGIPEPQPDHAIIMVKFAYVCRKQFNKLCRNLERSLGPGTGDLRMKFGIHSGPVTAGVLLGDKARFQLFGDTVNTGNVGTSSNFVANFFPY